MKYALGIAVAAAGICALAAGAHAAAVTLDFDRLDGSHTESVGNFYSGGIGGRGSGPGPHYGITFLPPPGASSDVTAPNAICKNKGFCSNPAAANALQIFGNIDNGLKNPGVDIHIANGFRGPVEFDAAIDNSGSADFRVVVKASLADSNRDALFIADITHVFDNPRDCGGLECPFLHETIPFPGEPFNPDNLLIHDILITTSGDDDLFIDNLHFSDLTPPPRRIRSAERNRADDP